MHTDSNSDETKPSESADAPPDPQLIATAFHEAGHAVMAIMLGRSVEKVTITPKRMPVEGIRLGVCKIQKGKTKASRDWMEDEILILLAGMVAEESVTGRYCESGAASDLRIVRGLLRNRPGSERQLAKIEKRLLEKTAYLLDDDEHRQAIESIAKELLMKTTISGRAARHFYNMSVAD